MKNKLLKRVAVLLAAVILLSAAVIYFTFDRKALDYLLYFRPESVGGALFVLCIGLFFDGSRLMNLTKAAGEKMKVSDAVSVVLSNYFFALLTPGASGGAVAQVVFMKKAGVPVATATAVVIIRTAMSIAFLLFLLPFIIYYDRALISSWLPLWLIIFFLVVFLVLPAIFVIFLNTRYPKQWIYGLTATFSHTWRRKIFTWYKDFKTASALLGKNPYSLFKAFVESGISLLGIYSVVPVFIAGLGISLPYQLVMGRMILLNLVLYFTPTPGGSGVAEAGFVLLFSPLLPEGLVGIVAVLWRLTCEYLPFLLGGIICARGFGSDLLTQISAEKREKH